MTLDRSYSENLSMGMECNHDSEMTKNILHLEIISLPP